MNVLDAITAHLGEVMALTSAITWAVAVILFAKSGEKVHPIGLNQFKNVLAIVLLFPTIILASGSFFPSVQVSDYLVLLASGALGIGIADTLFFHSLNVLGAGRSAIVDCLYSPFIIGLSIMWLGESLNLVQGIGVAMIISGVLTISGEGGFRSRDRRHLLAGIFWGAMAMATMAVGIVMAKPVLDRSDLLWVTLVRLFGGVAVLSAYLIWHPRRTAIVQSVVTAGHRAYTFTGAFIGGYLSMILWLAGMKYTQASTAAAMNQTHGIFVFILAALFLKERITTMRVIAIGLAIAGAIMVGVG